MPHITRQLLRKRAEHNEGIISTLEEITLHQEELESINEVLGLTCKKLKILYLQNNIIPKIENLLHLKDLQYLNLALNNIKRIEGLQNCEFLYKLDLTVNFIDVDELEDSINHLSTRTMLSDLFMMGNPSQSNWSDFNSYVIAKIPQLCYLDGVEITKSMRIVANQKLQQMEKELRALAIKKIEENSIKKMNAMNISSTNNNDLTVETIDGDDDDNSSKNNELTDHTPEVRVEIYKELAKEKKEKEIREKANHPKERDYEKEQKEAVEVLRRKEEETGEREIKQKNEGGWDFQWDEESKQGYVILEVHVAKFLDSSLIDVDVHPTFVSIIIKTKTLRLRLPAEVKVSESKCQRSKTTGSLSIVMPKVNPKENAISIRGDVKSKQKQSGGGVSVFNRASSISASGNRTTTIISRTGTKKLSLQEQMMLEASGQATPNTAASTTTAVDVKNIVRPSIVTEDLVDDPLELLDSGGFDTATSMKSFKQHVGIQEM